MVQSYFNPRTLFGILTLGSALALGGCSDDEKTKFSQEEAPLVVQQEERPCKAFAEISIYEVTIKQGDSLGKFNDRYRFSSNPYHNPTGEGRMEVPVQIPRELLRNSCHFTGIVGYDESSGSNVWGDVAVGNYAINLNSIVEVANGLGDSENTPHLSESELNRKLFHPGKIVRYVDARGGEGKKVGVVRVEVSPSAGSVCKDSQPCYDRSGKLTYLPL